MDAMTVAELIELLQDFPQDLQVHFRGYSCGGIWHAPVTPRDFVEVTHLETGEDILEITADWN